MASKRTQDRLTLLSATVTPLASILGSGLLIIVPVLERTLGAAAVFGAVGICAVAWLIGIVIRHNVRFAEPLKESGKLDRWTTRTSQAADGVIVVAYVISVALYLRIMAQYIVTFFQPDGNVLIEKIIACAAVALIVAIGIIRGFAGLNRLDRISLGAVILLTLVMGGVLVGSDVASLGSGDLGLPPLPEMQPLQTLLVLAGLVITVQGFETVRYLGDQYDAPTRIRASRWAQLAAVVIYVGFVLVATPAMGLGTDAGTDSTLLDIAGRVAPWLSIPLVLSAVLSQFSAAIADTAAADGNLRGLSRWFHGPRPFLISGVAAIALAATVPTLTIVAIASRAFAAYYALEAVIALRTADTLVKKIGFGMLAAVMVAIAAFAVPAG